MSEDKQVYICASPSEEIREMFPDNLYGNCPDCGDEITFRPDAPKDIKKLCFRCAGIDIEVSKANKEPMEVKLWNEEECKDLIKKLIQD